MHMRVGLSALPESSKHRTRRCMVCTEQLSQTQCRLDMQGLPAKPVSVPGSRAAPALRFSCRIALFSDKSPRPKYRKGYVTVAVWQCARHTGPTARCKERIDLDFLTPLNLSHRSPPSPTVSWFVPILRRYMTSPHPACS